MRSRNIASINLEAARIITAVATTFAAVSFGVLTMPNAHAASWNCQSLSGSGTYSNPYLVGRISTTTDLIGCAPLQEGHVKDFYAFEFSAPPSSSASVSTMAAVAGSGCRVGLGVDLGAVIVREPLNAQFLRTSDGQYNVDYQSLGGETATGLWRIVAQKICSITVSDHTKTYNIEIVP